jgi:maltose O-acetyltransferase
MRRLVKFICFILYKTIGVRLPAAWSRADIFSISAFRDFLCRHIVRKCGKHVIFGPHIEFSSDIEVGDYCGLGKGVIIEGETTIGRNVTVAREAILYTSAHYFTETRMQGVEIIPKVVGDNVYIGTRAMILANCRRIGTGAIIGAGAVVTKDVPDMTVVGGVPAKVIGPRKNTFQEAIDQGKNLANRSIIKRVAKLDEAGKWLEE